MTSELVKKNLASMEYRNEIDGIRFFSCLIVIFFHLELAGFENGWLGVDVFFVISGFLITQIIVKEIDASRSWLPAFYMRRVRRIIPHCIVALIFSWIPAYFFLYPEPMVSFAKSILASEIFLSNFLFFYESGYFDPISKQKPLLHTWSIALEWQFYLFYPIVLIVLEKLVGGKRAIKLSILSAMSFVIGLALWNYAPGAAFYLLPGRAWEFMLGGVLAVAPKHLFAIKLRSVLASLGVLLLLLSMTWVQDTNVLRHPGFFTLIPVLGSMLLVAYAPRTIVGEFLSLRPLAFLGKLSFGAYLWHYLIIKFIEIGFDVQVIADYWLLVTISSFTLSWFVFLTIENPLRYSVGNQRLGVFLLLSVAVLSLLSYSAIQTNGNMNRFAIPSAIANNTHSMPSRDNDFCFYSVGVFSNPVSVTEGITCQLVESHGLSDHNLLHFGDSFAASYDPFWKVTGGRIGADINSVSTNYCFGQFNQDFPGRYTSKAFKQCMINRAYLLAEASKFDAIILSGHWALIMEKGQLEGFITFVDALSKKTKIILMLSPPLYEQFDVNRRKWDETTNIKFSSRDQMRKMSSRLLLSDLGENPFVLILDPSQQYINNNCSNECYPISADGEHLSVYGSTEIGDDFVKNGGLEALKKFLD